MYVFCLLKKKMTFGGGTSLSFNTDDHYVIQHTYIREFNTVAILVKKHCDGPLAYLFL